jgi:hypothetical protein
VLNVFAVRAEVKSSSCAAPSRARGSAEGRISAAKEVMKLQRKIVE